jgi:hypothetical protein
MSPTRHHRHRLTRLARRAGRHVVRAGLAVGAVRLAAAVVGPALAAALAGLVFTVAAVAWWARVVEPRLCAPRPATTPPAARLTNRAPLDEDGRHLAFARVLALVAARYLAECEQQARQSGGGR